MIIEYHNASRDIGIKAYHDCKTVREFINKEISRMGNKRDKFFYIIRLKKDYNGDRNIVLYVQEDRVKCHHRTSAYFLLEPVLDYELYNDYIICDLKIRNILSYDLDSEEELRKSLSRRRKYDDDYLAYLRGEKKIVYYGSKAYDSLTEECEEKILNNIDKNKDKSDLLSNVEKLLIKKMDEISTLKLIIRELEDKNERKRQQLKWAKKILREEEDIHDIESRSFKGDV